MGNNIPTVEEFYSQNMSSHKEESLIKGVYNTMIEFTKLHVEAALKAAAENATVDNQPDYLGGEWSLINESSIKNAYPLTNIK